MSALSPQALNLLSILLLSAIFSPSSVHAGPVKLSLAASPFTAMTFAPVAVLPMFTIKISFLATRGSALALNATERPHTQLGNLGLLSIGCLHTQKSSKQEVVHLQLAVDLWQLAS